MASNNEQLSVVYEKSEYKWTLHKFSKIVDKNQPTLSKELESPVFPEKEGMCKWKLYLNPTEIQKNDYFGLYLTLVTKLGISTAVKYSFTLRNSDDEILTTKENTKTTFNAANCTWGFEKIISLKELLTSLKEDNVLKIFVLVSVEILVLQPYHSLRSLEEKKPLTKLSCELETWITNDKFHDFTIKVNGTVIPVHRIILAARSSVFSAMFEHDVIEKNLGYVEINDVSESTMLRLLKFVYTGQVQIDDLIEDEIKQLFAAADKYAVLDLKKICSQILTCRLTVSNVLDILILSEIHSEPELKIIAMDYIVANFWKFCRPEKMEQIKAYPNLMFEMLQKIFKLCQEKFEIKL